MVTFWSILLLIIYEDMASIGKWLRLLMVVWPGSRTLNENSFDHFFLPNVAAENGYINLQSHIKEDGFTGPPSYPQIPYENDRLT